jgi:hypothetical protein
MVTNATQTFVFSIVDANNEYNTKIILLGTLFFYLVVSLWWANKIIPFKATRDEVGKFPLYKQISVMLMRVVPIVFLFFYPLIIGIFMYRDYSIDSLITLIVTGYTVMTAISIGLWFLFGMNWVQDFLATIGIQTKDKKGTIIRGKD